MRIIYFILLVLVISSCHKPDEDLHQPDLINKDVKATDFRIDFITKDTVAADTSIYTQVKLTVGAVLANRYKVAFLSIGPIGQFSNHKDTITLSIDVNNSVHAYVTSNVVGLATIKASIGNLSHDTSLLYTVRSLDTIRISVINDNVPADNYSYAEIIVQTSNPKNLSNARTVTFTTDRGTFSNNKDTFTTNIVTDSTHKTYILARAYLKNDHIEKARVTATISNTNSVDTIVTFTPSWPQYVSINADSTSLKDTFGTTSKITAKLSRSYGIVSPLRFVYFKDSLSGSGKSIGSFINTTLSDNAGSVTTQFWLHGDSTAHNKVIFIEGFVVTDNRDTIRGYNQIYLR